MIERVKKSFGNLKRKVDLGFSFRNFITDENVDKIKDVIALLIIKNLLDCILFFNTLRIKEL